MTTIAVQAAAGQPGGGPRAMSYAIAIVLLGLAIFLSVTFLPGGEADPSAERFNMGAAMRALPGWVRQWMSFQHFVFAGSLLFIWWHREARVYLVGIIVSHAIAIGGMMFAPADRIGLGLISLNHMVWIPALAYMILRYSQIDKRTPYSIWYHVALFQLCFSLGFDIRDSAIYLGAMLG